MSCAYISIAQLESSYLSFSIKGLSLPLKGYEHELDMGFGCKVFDILPNREIFANFCGPNRAISSFPYDFGLHDYEWVDTGHVRALDDAKTEEIIVEDTTDSAAIVCISDSHFDLIVGNSRLLDNSEVSSKIYENSIADSLLGYSAIPGHQVFNTMSDRHGYSKSWKVVCVAHGIDYSDRYNGNSAFQLEKITVYYSDIWGVAEV